MLEAEVESTVLTHRNREENSFNSPTAMFTSVGGYKLQVYSRYFSTLLGMSRMHACLRKLIVALDNPEKF